MSGKNIKFGGEKVNKKSFYRNKKLFKMEGIDINKILVSKTEPYGENYILLHTFTYIYILYTLSYNDDDGIRSLCKRLPQMIGYVKCFKDNNNKDKKKMSFNNTGKRLLKNYNKIWEKVSNLLNKEFDSEPVYGDKYIRTKIKEYGDKTNTNFQGKKMSNENESYKCLSLIMLESVIKRQNKKYYPQTLLKECKCEIKQEENGEPY